MTTAPRSPTDTFRGPPHLLAPWQVFRDQYTEHGAYARHANNAALLERLAFGDGATGFLSRYADRPEDARLARKGIEDAARVLSQLTSRAEFRPLHRALVSSLMHQWIEAEKRHGLYPPRTVASKHGATNSDRDDAQRRFAELLRSPEGSILAGALTMAYDHILRETARRVSQTNDIAEDDAFPAAHDQFLRSLRAFREDQPASFTTYLWDGLRYVALNTHRQNGKAQEAATASSATAQDVPDAHAASPFETAAKVSEHEHLRGVIARLRPRHRDVLVSRFGLADGTSRTLQEVADELGVSKEAVRLIEQQALERCRTLMQSDDPGPDSTPSRNSSTRSR